MSGFAACRTSFDVSLIHFVESLLLQLNRSWAWLTNPHMPQPLSVFGWVVKANNNVLRSFENLKGVQPCEYNQIFWNFFNAKFCSIWFSSRNVWLNGWRLEIKNFSDIPGSFQKKKIPYRLYPFQIQKLVNFCLNGKHSGNLFTGTVMNNWHSYWPVVLFGQNLSKLVKIRTLIALYQ